MSLGIVAMVAVLGAAGAGVGAEGTPSPIPRSEGASDRTDEALAATVEKRLRLEDRIRWKNIRVDVENGAVTLYGTVPTPEERGWAAKTAGTVPGVAAVTNRILVEPGHEGQDERREAAHVEEQERDRVLEGQPGLKDRQILP